MRNQGWRVRCAFAVVLAACTSEEKRSGAASEPAAEGGRAAAQVASAEARAVAAGKSGGAALASGASGRRAALAGRAGSAEASVPAATAGGAGAAAGTAAAGRFAPMTADAPSGPYVCQAKLAANPSDPGGEGAQGSACCGGLGSCQRQDSLTLELKASLGHETCKTSDLLCAPVANKHAGVCHAQTGAAALEGRCLPRCFVAGSPSALLVTTTDCNADAEQICATCYDPVSGRTTGVCTLQPGDQPTEPAPAAYKECGTYMGGAAGGVCMPKSLAVASGNSVAATLPQDSCANSEVCLPKLKSADFNACFSACETSALVQAAGSKEGGCIPPYIAAQSNPEAVTFLEQGACAAGELCAPCLDPTKDFKVSGACE